MLKKKVGPGVIVIAVIALAAYLIMMSKTAFAPRQPGTSPDNAPQYAKDMMKKGGAGNPYANVMQGQQKP